VHICDNFHNFQDWGGAEHGYAVQRAAVLHEFFHLIGYMDAAYCQCAVKYAWSEFNVRSPDNYQLFITGVNGVPTACEIYQAINGTDDSHCM
jgi:predicted secreted protein